MNGAAFWYRSGVSIDLGRRLIAAGLVSPDEVEAALFLSVARGVPFARALNHMAETVASLDEAQAVLDALVRIIGEGLHLSLHRVRQVVILRRHKAAEAHPVVLLQ